MKAVKTVGRCVDVRRKTEGGAGKERAGQGRASDVASHTVCRLLPGTRSVRGGTAFFWCVPFRESCVTTGTIDCLFVADSTARYSTFVLLQVYNMVLPAKDLTVPESGN